MNRQTKQLIGLLFCLMFVGTSQAIPVTYTDSTAFLSDLALSGLTPTTLNFDDLTAGTTIASGAATSGITFTYDFGGVQMMVSDIYDTTSAPNFLGTDDGYVFQSGDNFAMGFAPTHAIGMYFLSADTIGSSLLDGDITLGAGGASALLDTTAVQQTLADGTNVFFLGIMDTAATFTSASVDSTCCGYFLFNVDDITTATESVPEPGTLLLLTAGLVGISFLRKRS